MVLRYSLLVTAATAFHPLVQPSRKRPLVGQRPCGACRPAIVPRATSDDETRESNTIDEMNYLRNELMHIESLEEILAELEEYTTKGDTDDLNDYDFSYLPDEDSEDDPTIWDKESLEELLRNLPDEEVDTIDVETSDVEAVVKVPVSPFRASAARGLEQALLQGVVPVSAGVGSECLPGDFGFDPLGLSDRDLMRPVQSFLLGVLPPPILASMRDDVVQETINVNPVDSSIQDSTNGSESDSTNRPKALVLRDYREAEIRHGRLAMLAAVVWPLQEMLDRWVLTPEQFGPLIYGPVTLPYFPLSMTAILMLLGYLDIYSQAIKDRDQIGEAFLPGDCFWDPLRMLEGAPDRMKRNMQERELFNGRAAMLAVAAYTLEEAVTHKALIDIESNALLLEPAYQVPFIQNWLDAQFIMSGLSELVPDSSTDMAGMDVDSMDAITSSFQTLFAWVEIALF